MLVVLILMSMSMMIMMDNVYAGDTNSVFDPCSDTRVQRWDGFTFGLVFSSKESFFFNESQLSPCDRRLSLTGNSAELAVFRPKVDEISLLTINISNFNPVCTLISQILFLSSYTFVLHFLFLSVVLANVFIPFKCKLDERRELTEIVIS